ncbi:MAG: HRDC domain-containing protein [Alphaproteobacteria bacterium]|nr:HRDC domain-containing protein [Alphaproteobacteria bacterium]
MSGIVLSISDRSARACLNDPVRRKEAGRPRIAECLLWSKAQVPSFSGLPNGTAQANAVPPYVIFHDATLAEMVRAKPNTLPALGRISGIGEAKLKKYGTEVLAVLIAGI